MGDHGGSCATTNRPTPNADRLYWKQGRRAIPNFRLNLRRLYYARFALATTLAFTLAANCTGAEPASNPMPQEPAYQAKTLAQWKVAANDAKPKVRQDAAKALGQLGPAAIPVLVDLLADEDGKVRSDVTQSLKRIGSAAVPPLTALLSDKRPAVRLAAAKALKYFGTQAKPAAAALVATLKDKDDAVREAAFNALPRVGQRRESCHPWLIEGLHDKSYNVHNAARHALRDWARKPSQFLWSRSITRTHGYVATPRMSWAMPVLREEWPCPPSWSWSRTAIRKFAERPFPR